MNIKNLVIDPEHHLIALVLENGHLLDGLLCRSQRFLHCGRSITDYINHRYIQNNTTVRDQITGWTDDLSAARFHYFDSVLINRQSNILATFSFGSSTRSNFICFAIKTNARPHTRTHKDTHTRMQALTMYFRLFNRLYSNFFQLYKKNGGRCVPNPVSEQMTSSEPMPSSLPSLLLGAERQRALRSRFLALVDHWDGNILLQRVGRFFLLRFHQQLQIPFRLAREHRRRQLFDGNLALASLRHKDTTQQQRSFTDFISIQPQLLNLVQATVRATYRFDGFLGRGDGEDAIFGHGRLDVVEVGVAREQVTALDATGHVARFIRFLFVLGHNHQRIVHQFHRDFVQIEMGHSQFHLPPQTNCQCILSILSIFSLYRYLYQSCFCIYLYF